MKSMLQRGLAALFCTAAVSFACAQTPPAAPLPNASAPGVGLRGGGPMHGWHMHKGNTPGWSMMSRAERDEHRNKMMDMNNYDECRAYMDQHHTTMAARAQSRGHTVPAQPSQDPCLRLKK